MSNHLYLFSGLCCLTIDNATFAKNMGVLPKNDKYNYLTEILADSNDCSIKIVRFQGKDKQKIILRNEYGVGRQIKVPQNAPTEFPEV